MHAVEKVRMQDMIVSKQRGRWDTKIWNKCNNMGDNNHNHP